MDSLKRGMTTTCLIDPLVIPLLYYIISVLPLTVSLDFCFRVMSAGFVQSLIRDDECLNWTSGNIFVSVFCKCL